MENNFELEELTIAKAMPDLEWSRAGLPILKRELLDNGEVFKIHSKLRNFNPDEKLDSLEDIKKLKDFYWYESTYDGSYISENDYNHLVLEKGLILLQKIVETDTSASIGYSPKEHKWYGWSHRAIYGFGIGDEVHEGDLTNTTGLIEEYAIQHPEENRSLPVGFKAKNLYDAKRMAIAFACAVG